MCHSGGIAQKAGITTSDIITKVNNAPVTSPQHFAAAVCCATPTVDSPVVITVLRIGDLNKHSSRSQERIEIHVLLHTDMLSAQHVTAPTQNHHQDMSESEPDQDLHNSPCTSPRILLIIYIYIFTYKCLHTHTYIYACYMYRYMYMCTQILYMYAYIYISMCLYTCILTHTHAHTHIRTCTHAHTHTHISFCIHAPILFCIHFVRSDKAINVCIINVLCIYIYIYMYIDVHICIYMYMYIYIYIYIYTYIYTYI